MITIEVVDRGVLDALQKLIRRMGDPAPVLKAIGEDLAESTKRRFETSTAPDGARWAPNQPSTILGYLGAFKGSTKKSGGLSKRGAARAGIKKPLIGESKYLSVESISYQVIGDTLLIGSQAKYAATQQFGADRGAFGRTKHGSPIPWGDIPPRPFLGLSDGDREGILEIVNDYLGGDLK